MSVSVSSMYMCSPTGVWLISLSRRSLSSVCEFTSCEKKLGQYFVLLLLCSIRPQLTCHFMCLARKLLQPRVSPSTLVFRLNPFRLALRFHEKIFYSCWFRNSAPFQHSFIHVVFSFFCQHYSSLRYNACVCGVHNATTSI